MRRVHEEHNAHLLLGMSIELQSLNSHIENLAIAQIHKLANYPIAPLRDVAELILSEVDGHGIRVETIFTLTLKT